MKKLILTALLAAFATVGHTEMVKVASPYAVRETLDRLSEIVTGAGATVFARVEHATGAEMIGEELAPMAVLIFGKPQIGTSALQTDPLTGVALPARVLAYQDADGQVWLVYENPADMFARFELADDAPVVALMTRVLAGLTAQAVAE